MGRGPYYTISQAAEYCGYRSAKYFRRLAEEYGVPVKGPHQVTGVRGHRLFHYRTVAWSRPFSLLYRPVFVDCKAICKQIANSYSDPMRPPWIRWYSLGGLSGP